MALSESPGKAVKNIATVQRQLGPAGFNKVGDCECDWKELSGYAAFLRSKIKECWATRSVATERCVPKDQLPQGVAAKPHGQSHSIHVLLAAQVVKSQQKTQPLHSPFSHKKLIA